MDENLDLCAEQRSEHLMSDHPQNVPTVDQKDDSIFGCDPFGPVTEDQMERMKKRFQEAKDLRMAAAEEASAYSLEMYDNAEVVQRLTSVERQKDMEHLRSILRKMQITKSRRELTPQPRNYDDLMNRLSKRYPHFGDVIELLRARMRMNALKKHPTVDFGGNLLLLGAPGCGKSSFLCDLGEALGTKFSVVSCAAASTSAELTGLSSCWGNGHPGIVHELLVQQGCANPIFLLDEVEKSQSEGQQPFMHALYGLLEKSFARNFKDEFVNVTINASKINWFASANDVNSLDPPIRDRFEVIHVNVPSRSDLELIVPQIYKRQVDDHGLQHIYAPSLSDDILSLLLKMKISSIRRIKVLIERALANAAIRANQDGDLVHLVCEDFPDMRSEQESLPRIGFI
ncbi:AAA domain (dynein-related subfamily) [Mariprofundus aestuarium]|uniref:AAA domain (Dynein-related subfamily) n=1 Tax=Mariprofundus aestuarium TaxID=1921086 RepID=A0A2K8L4H4_MARES|nr:AAA family ATPase [Mariprofundus aestuarium]ATX79136.1 AAA domain (dynein-related subfamily) [Mariprofundus aestuarium]